MRKRIIALVAATFILAIGINAGILYWNHSRAVKVSEQESQKRFSKSLNTIQHFYIEKLHSLFLSQKFQTFLQIDPKNLSSNLYQEKIEELSIEAGRLTGVPKVDLGIFFDAPEQGPVFVAGTNPSFAKLVDHLRNNPQTAQGILLLDSGPSLGLLRLFPLDLVPETSNQKTGILVLSVPIQPVIKLLKGSDELVEVGFLTRDKSLLSTAPDFFKDAAPLILNIESTSPEAFGIGRSGWWRGLGSEPVKADFQFHFIPAKRILGGWAGHYIFAEDNTPYQKAFLMGFWISLVLSFLIAFVALAVFHFFFRKVLFGYLQERKQVREDLRENQDILAHSQRISKLGSFKWKISDNELIWSEELFRIYKRPKVQGAPVNDWLNLIHQDDRDLVRSKLEEVFAGESQVDLDYKIVCSDGEIKHVHSEAEVLYDESGQPMQLIGTAMDVTDKKKMEEEISFREEKFRNLFEYSNDGIILHDFQGNIIDANKKALDQFGFDKKEMLLLRIQSLLSDKPESQRVFKLALDTLKTEGFIFCELEFQKKTLITFPTSVSANVVMIDGKKVVQSILRDITSQKRYEAELKYAKQKAESAAKAKANFLATMSHEIRTPMNGVIGLSNLLKSSDLSPDQKEYVDNICYSGELLLKLINDILDLSKIEAGKMELEEQGFDLRQLVESMLEMFAMGALQKQIELLYWIEPEVPTWITGDVVRLRQILLNLIGNAVKFTEKGEVMLRISCQKKTEEGFELLFSIKDTGIGIPDDAKDKLFQSFTQVDSSTTRKFGGTGLGLTITKKLLDLMGGTLEVESQPEKGSDFRFTLMTNAPEPQANNSDITIDLSVATSQQIGIFSRHQGQKSVLAKNLQSFGFDPVILDSIEEAHQQASTLSVLLLDLDRLSQNESSSLLQAFEKKKIIALTYESTESKSTGDKKNFSKLRKPVKRQALLRALRFMTDNKAGPDENPNNHDNLAAFYGLGERYGLKVLVAEDNQISQLLIQKILEKFGIQANIAVDGLDVLSRLKKSKYDIIFMDIQMSGMDGVEVTRRILDNDRLGSKPKIIAMTANALPEDKKKYLEAGMDDYLSKPILPEQVGEKLAYWGQILKDEGSLTDSASKEGDKPLPS